MRHLAILTLAAIGFLQAAYASEPVTKEQQVKRSLFSISIALGLYKLDHGSYPTESEGLTPLLRSSPSSRPAYLRSNPIDPWGNPYQYTTSPCAHAFSFGADGKLGGEGEAADIHFQCKDHAPE
jgi:type II secretion system protein G